MTWLTGLLSSSNNNYLAIGRVLGLMLFINLLLALPVTIVLALWLRGVQPLVWYGLLSALTVYVPAIILAVVGVISGTAFTERPQPTTMTAASAVVSTETTRVT